MRAIGRMDQANDDQMGNSMYREAPRRPALNMVVLPALYLLYGDRAVAND